MPPRDNLRDQDTGGKCGAKTRKGTPCQRKAGAGTNHVGQGRCRNHGGKAPQVELRHAVDKARDGILKQLGHGTPISPIEGILKAIAIANAEVDYWTVRIAELQEQNYTGPEVSSRPLKLEKGAEDSTTRVEDHGPTLLNIAFRARREARADLVQYSKEALRAGVAERQIKLAENQAQMMAACIRGILTDLGIVNHPDAPAIVRRHLSLVANTIDSTAIELPQASEALETHTRAA